MLEQLAKSLKDNCRLEPGQRLLVAVSGGPDSLCLLHLLKQLNYHLVAAHLDHQLRPESSQEAQAVARLLQKWSIEARIEQADVASYASQRTLSIEEAARELRYRFLFRQAQECQAAAVITAHTADDQVETVLMHLLRGSGLAGLRGMAYHSQPNPWSATIPLVRPLLGAWRSEITAYLQTHGLEAFEDPSNLDQRYYRNRIRHELAPLLATYNPQFKQRLWQTAELLSQDYDLLTASIDQAWQTCLVAESPAHAAFDYTLLRAQPPSMQRHLVRRAAYRLKPDLRDVDYHSLERARAFIAHPTQTRQVDWLAGLRLVLEGGILWLAIGDAALQPLQDAALPRLLPVGLLPLAVPGCLDLQTGWQIRAESVADIEAAQETAAHNTDPFQAWLCIDSAAGGLAVRTRRPGDRFCPLGMDGHSIKLSDLMINLKVPRLARQNWPLVVCGEEIAWIPGLRSAERFRLSAGCRSAVHLNLSPV